MFPRRVWAWSANAHFLHWGKAMIPIFLDSKVQGISSSVWLLTCCPWAKCSSPSSPCLSSPISSTLLPRAHSGSVCAALNSVQKVKLPLAEAYSQGLVGQGIDNELVFEPTNGQNQSLRAPTQTQHSADKKTDFLGFSI